MFRETYEVIEDVIIDIYIEGREGNIVNEGYLYEATKVIKGMLPKCQEDKIREVLLEAYEIGEEVLEGRNETLYEEDVPVMTEGDREELIKKLIY